ncbi:MAG: TIGR00266 family protein [Acidobacteriota bacterium]
MATWEPAGSRPEFAAAFGPLGASAAVPPPPPAGQVAHEIDYEIVGEEMQFVEITLDPNEACIAEAGAFMYMDPGIQMETIFGDGSAQQQGGLMGALLAAGKRVLVGESLFMTLFGNTASTRQKVAFAAPYPGRIVPMDLRQLGGTVLCQKDAFLCAAKGISVGIAFQKKLGTGLFGGEGFILEKLQGDGLAFVHASGAIVSRQLGAGETLRVDTGCLVAFEPRVNYDIQMVSGIKTALFGGEGLFFATLTGPGKVWIQSLPFSRLASRIYAAAPQAGGHRREEGSILGPLGSLLGGDR